MMPSKRRKIVVTVDGGRVTEIYASEKDGIIVDVEDHVGNGLREAVEVGTVWRGEAEKHTAIWSSF